MSDGLKPAHARRPGDALNARSITDSSGLKEQMAEAYMNAREYDPVGTTLAMAMFQTPYRKPMKGENRALLALIELEQEAYMSMYCGACGSYNIEKTLDEPTVCNECGHSWYQTPTEHVPSNPEEWDKHTDNARQSAAERDRPWDRLRGE